MAPHWISRAFFSKVDHVNVVCLSELSLTLSIITLSLFLYRSLNSHFHYLSYFLVCFFLSLSLLIQLYQTVTLHISLISLYLPYSLFHSCHQLLAPIIHTFTLCIFVSQRYVYYTHLNILASYNNEFTSHASSFIQHHRFL